MFYKDTKPGSSICVMLMIAYLMCLCFYTPVSANSAEPPGFTIIVLNSSENLSLSLQLPNDSVTDIRVTGGERKGWEKYYRLYYKGSFLQAGDLKNAVLMVQSNSKNFQCALTDGTFDKYNNIFTLDMESETLTIGQDPLRVPTLVALRVVLTFLIEGAVFLLFGYQQKRSWLVFAVINLITQAGLNAMLTGPDLSNYWILGYIFGEIVVLVVELTAFLIFIKEFRKRHTALYVLVANTVSLLLGGMMITYLPV